MSKKPTVYLFCGLPAAGKTTLARQLEEKQGAIRFTLDEWMIRLYGETVFEHDYGSYGRRCRELIWQTAVSILNCGLDVVLDWNQWNSKRRRETCQRIEAVGATHQLFYLNIPPAIARERLRGYQTADFHHILSVAEFDRFLPFFEPPTTDEALNIVEVKYRRDRGSYQANTNHFIMTTPARKTYPPIIN